MVLSTLYEANFNAFPIGNCLLSPDFEAIILAVNDVFLKASSRRREDLVGMNLFMAFPGNPDDTNDTGEAAVRNSIARVLATGQPDKLPVQRYPILVEQSDGEVRYEERFWSSVNTPVLGADGKIICISHSTTDVTELIRSETAIRESDIRFRALVNATSDVIYRMTPDWKYMHELDGRGFLKTTSQLAEYRIEEYVYPDDLDLARNAIDEAIRHKTIFALEHRVLRADGSHGWTYSRAVPILDDKGEIREWVGMASDITERKEVEEKLKDANKRKDEFLAMLAHELRNPLAPVGAAAELLQMVKLDEERVRQTSQIIGRQVEHMTGLIDDLLDVSRVTRGKVELDVAPLDINQVLTDAVEQVSPLVSQEITAWHSTCHPVSCWSRATRSGWFRSWPTC
jgi:signal transduction histidine kinase